jgi:hypothetical protein
MSSAAHSVFRCTLISSSILHDHFTDVNVTNDVTSHSHILPDHEPVKKKVQCMVHHSLLFNICNLWDVRFLRLSFGLGAVLIGGRSQCFGEACRLHPHYHRHIPLYHPKKSAVAESSVSLGRRIQLHDTSILAKKARQTDRIIREAKETELQLDNMNKDNGFFLTPACKPLIRGPKSGDRHIKYLTPSSGSWKGLPSSVLPPPPHSSTGSLESPHLSVLISPHSVPIGSFFQTSLPATL